MGVAAHCLMGLVDHESIGNMVNFLWTDKPFTIALDRWLPDSRSPAERALELFPTFF